MRALSVLIVFCLLLVAGCTTTQNADKPKIHCPACGTEFDAIFHKNF
jgi:hypothetical protein